MKPERRTEQPTAMERLADEMCALFWDRDWTPSMENFEPRQFVKHHGTFFSAAGTNPAGRNCSIACRTAEEVIAFLESASEEPVAEASAPVVVAAPVEPTPQQPDPRDDELAALRAELEAERAKPPVVVEKIVEKIVEVQVPAEAPLPDLSTPMIAKEIADLMEPGETLTHDVRRKLTERLNVELAELKNLRGLAGEDLKREAEIEKLLGLFARLGEI